MIGTRLSDRFELTGELGRGGMGIVFRARDPVLGREVAVKTIALGDSPEAHEARFRREAQVVAGLDHPGIVPIFDFGRHEDFLYFVMPLIAGKTLHELISDEALLLGETLEIVAQVAEALDYSSSRGVVHRDVKPENVMVTRGGGAPRARIMDFGLALPAAGSRITKTGQLPGTLAYLSPEYILSLDLDGRSDLYSLGTILYECLAGEPPFTGAQGSVLFRIVHEEPPTLGVDEGLAEIVLRCLAKEPGDRPASGGELARQLRAYRETLSESARARQPVSPELRLLQARRSQAAPLVGRTAELAELTRRLDAALAGECQLVLVGGEAGIGKTRLLLELELRARARGVKVVTGRFSSHQGTFPHHGLCELIEDFFRGRTELDSAGGEPELADLAAELLQRFPVLAEIGALREAAGGEVTPPAGGAAAADPTRVFELLARTLIRLAAGRPVVMLLENLQAAETSIEALGYFVRRASPTPTLVVGTYRQVRLSRRHGISRLVRSFADDARFAHLVLEPLPPGEHRELVLSLLESASGVSLRLDEELAERLYDATEGNPFFTRELVRSLLDARDISRDATGSWVLASESALMRGALPETIQQAVEARLERLEDGLLRTLKTASVLGRSFAVADLKWLTGEAEEVEEALDALLEAGILEEERRAKGDVLAFASGVVRDVLHGALTRRRRRSLHRRFAARLEERHAGRLERVYPELVHHFSLGDEAVKTVTYALMLARMSAGAFSPADTVRATRTALAFVEDEDLGDSGEVEGELRLLLAGALKTAGNIAGALAEAGRAARVFEEGGEMGPAAAACLTAAETAWQNRRIEDTRRWLGKGIYAARAADAGGRLRQLLTLAATVANLRGEHRQARAWLEEAEGLDAGAVDADAPPAGGVLISALSNTPTTDDPVAGLSLEDAEVLGNVFDPLLGYDAEGNLVPRLCDGWEDSEGGDAFTLFLRPGVHFSDGMPLTAREVKRSLEGSARRAAEVPAALAALAGTRRFAAGSASEVRGLEVLADDRIRCRLREPLPIFPALLTDLRTAIVRESEDGLLGTGPFRVVSRRPRRIVLERNPRDWRARPALLDGIEMRVFPDARSIAAGLRSGELDLGRDLSPDDLDEVLKDPELRGGLVEAPKKNVYFVLFNLAGPAAREPEVRRVLSHALRPHDLVWRTLGRFAQPATCLIPPGILGHDPGRQLPSLSRDEAAEALGRAGVVPPLELTAAVHPLLADRYGSLLSALLDEWRALGVEVGFRGSSMESFLGAWRDCRGLDLMIMRWVPDYDDPDNLTHTLFHSRHGLLRCYLGEGSVSRRLDELLGEARHERDRSRRRVLYRKIEGVLAENNVLLPLFHDIDYRIAGPRVKGLRHLSSPPWVNYSRLGKEPPGARASGTGSAAGATAPAAAPRDVPGAALRVPVPSTFDSLEPALALFIEPAEVVPNVFETLTRVGEGARIEPCLAAGYAVKDGGRRLQLTLRDPVRFHDGRKLTTRDVRYSFERLLRSGYPGVESALMPIRGARDFHAGRSDALDGLEIHSPTELEIHLREPIGFFPAMLSNPMTVIVPEGADGFTGNWRTGCAGTGPFRVVGFLAGERIELEANPDYWRPGVPACGRLTFELGVEASQAGAAFRAGELQVASGLRPEDVEALRRDADFVHGFRESPGLSTYFLVPNSRRGPFADRQLRRAFAEALDLESILRTTLGPLGLPAHGLISPGLLGHESRPLRRRRPTSSSAGLSGLAIETSLHAAFTGQYAHVWRELAAAIAAAGVVANVVEGPTSELLERIRRGDVDLAAARRVAAYPDADAFVHLFHSTDGLLGQLLDDEEIDRLIEQGRVETDPTLRHGIYRQIEQILAREALLIPLFDEQVYCFARPEVKGLRIRLGWPKVAYDELSLEY